MIGLADYLDFNLKIIFIGYNPGEKSDILKYHYAGRGNQFWKLLYESGLTTRLLSPSEDKLLLLEGYGLTNLVARPSKSSSDLSPDEMRTGAQQLRKKLIQYHPKIACFLGKEVFRKYAGLKTSIPVSYGLVSTKEIIEGMQEFIAPNPSGRSTIPYAEKLAAFQELYNLIHSQ